MADPSLVTIAFPKPGSVLAGRYVLQAVLGAGRHGTVYLAAHAALAREVAIKVAPPEGARALVAEAASAARVCHPGSVVIHDVGIAPSGDAYVVMERVRGRPLSWIIDEQPLPVIRAISIANQLIAALEAAHDAGVVHGDLTSANVLVDETAAGDRVVVIDYGEATCDAARPPTGVASDIRAAGQVLYEMITGSTEVASTGHKLLPMAVRRPALELPAALDYVVMRALEVDPQRRFPTAEAMRRSLETIDCARVLPRYHRSTVVPVLSAEGSGASRVLARLPARTTPPRRPSQLPDDLLLAPRR